MCLVLLCQHAVYVSWQLWVDNGDRSIDCGSKICVTEEGGYYLEFWCF